MPDEFRRPAWNEAAIWMGMTLPAIGRMFWRNRFRIRPACWLDATIDLLFAGGNSLVAETCQCVSPWKSVDPQQAGAPVFVVGHWRTGTTLMHELLAVDPQLRFPNCYECFLPHHFPWTEKAVAPCLGFALPAQRPPDAMRLGWDLPQEDEFALCNLGVPSPYLTMAFPNHGPANDAYYELDGLPDSAQQAWRRAWTGFLSRLVSFRPGRLLLKSPTHTFRIPTLVSLFPDARFVYLVRDPREVYSSTVRLWRSMYSVHGYQRADESKIPEQVIDTFSRLHERVRATRGMVVADRWFEVRYEQFVRAPMDHLREIYARFGLGETELLEPDWRQNLESRRNYQPNQHRLADHDLAKLRERWKDFLEAYDYSI